MPAKQSDHIYVFKDVSKDDIALVGSKGAALGEMLTAGFPVPNGFILSSNVYFKFLKDNNLTVKINHLIATINFDHPESLLQVSTHIKKLFMDGVLSEELIQEIFKKYKSLGGVLQDPLITISTSATAEDLSTAAFAGKQEIFTDIKGEANVILKIKEAWASLFEPRAIFTRHQQKFDHFRVGTAVIIQLMIHEEKSGIMFTLDPITNDKSKVIIEAIYGLGDYIVSGKVTPDHYEVDKAEKNILKRFISSQEVKLEKVKEKPREVSISSRMNHKQKISDEEVIALADLGRKIEKHYYFPQDIEWAIEKGKIYIIHTRAVTTRIDAKQNVQPTSHLPLLIAGSPASPGIASGPVRIIRSIRDLHTLQPGDVLVTSQTTPDFMNTMKKASAIITDTGGRTSHAAIVSREIGTPAVVGAEKATELLKNGMVVTVNGSKGEVYKGATFLSQLPTSVAEKQTLKTATKVYVNLGEPELATSIAATNVDGVGLLRAEFMMAGIGVHPKKMIRDGRKQEFITKLANGLEEFCTAFNPRPVVYRASDFKTNEYRGLVGGKEFEPMENNPLLGYRGAFRYIHDPEVFEMELEAIKIVRQKKNLKNLWLMVPFVRNVKELVAVKKMITNAGLQRSPLFRLWMMVEVPANVIQLEEFINVGIDGVAVGTNDLTMLMLGADRDNSEVARAYNEQDPAVLWALEQTIKIARKNHVTVSVCGQAASIYPDLLEKVVGWGVTSVSVSADVLPSVREHIAKIERKILK